MNRSIYQHYLGLIAFSCVIVTGRAADEASPSPPPNIVILFADDLGYGDLSSYGSDFIATPAIDRIGQQGIRFTHFYTNTAECTPSRVALLTGRYPQRVGGLECAIGNLNVGRYDEAIWLRERDELGLPASEPIIAQLLREQSYATAISGKWHLGYGEKFSPAALGFDESLIVLPGGVDYVSHTEMDGSPAMLHNGAFVDRDGYLTDVIADHAINWLTQQTSPYFLYVPFTAPHSPYQAPGDGPEPLPWDKGDAETYRQMIEHLDLRIGDIVAAIDGRPDAANTIVIFLSDNGATGPGSNAPLRGGKGFMWEGGIRVPCLLRWPARISNHRESSARLLNMDLNVTLLRLAGVDLDQTGFEFDGIDARANWLAETPLPERDIFFRYKRYDRRRYAVMHDNLKLVIHDEERALFDLTVDEPEQFNLATERPEVVAQLIGKIRAWEAKVEAPRLEDFVPLKVLPDTLARP